MPHAPLCRWFIGRNATLIIYICTPQLTSDLWEYFFIFWKGTKAMLQSRLLNITRTSTDLHHPELLFFSTGKRLQTSLRIWIACQLAGKEREREREREKLEEIAICLHFFLGHDVFYLCFSSSTRIDFSLWQGKKNSKKMRTSGQVHVDKYCPRHTTVAEKETDCSTQTTVLWRLMEKASVKLLVSKLFLAVYRSSK